MNDSPASALDRSQQRQIMRTFGRAVGREAYCLRQWPELTWQQLYNWLQFEHQPLPARLADEFARCAEHRERPWIRRLRPPRVSERFMARLTGHTGTVSACAFSPDGKLLATGSADDTVRLWDGPTGIPLAVLRGHTDSVRVVAFSPDGSRLASGSWDHTVRIWDGRTGAALAVLGGHTDWIQACAFSPDGTVLATASADKDRTVRLWDVPSAVSRTTIGASVRAVTFSPDGALLATANQDGTARLWDVRTGLQVAMLSGHEWEVLTCTFSPDGTLLATGSADDTARLWHVETRAQVAVLRGHRGSILGGVQACCFSPDGTRLATTGGGGPRLWDGHSGALLGVLEDPTPSYMDRPYMRRSCAFSADGSVLATSGGEDRTTRLWDARTGAPLAVLEGHTAPVEAFAVSPAGSALATAGGHPDQDVCLWNGQSGVSAGILDGHTEAITACAFSPDGVRLATASEDQTARLWNGQSGAPVAILQDGVRNAIAPPEAGMGVVTDCAFSPDGTALVTAGGGAPRLWDGWSGAFLAVLKGSTGLHLTCAFSPNGALVATASGLKDSAVRLWDGRTGAPLAELAGPGGAVRDCSFNPDGVLLATVHQDGLVLLFEVPSATSLSTPLAVLRGHTDDILACAFSPDGAILATASDDRTARLWNGRSGAAMATLEHGTPVSACAFSPDGVVLATGSHDGTAWLWSVRDRTPQVMLRGHTDRVHVCCFSPDGALLATASHDGTVRLWNVRSGTPLRTLPLGSPGLSLTFHPWTLKLAAGTSTGEVLLCEIVGLRPGRVLKAATSSDPGPELRCPRCQKTAVIASDRIGHEIDCPNPGCGLPLKLNPFIIEMRPTRAPVTEPSPAVARRPPLPPRQEGAAVLQLAGQETVETPQPVEPGDSFEQIFADLRTFHLLAPPGHVEANSATSERPSREPASSTSRPDGREDPEQIPVAATQQDRPSIKSTATAQAPGAVRPLRILLAAGLALAGLMILARLVASRIGAEAYATPLGSLLLVVGVLVSIFGGVVVAIVVGRLVRVHGHETICLSGLAAFELLIGLVAVVVLALRALLLGLGLVAPGPAPDWVRWVLGW